MNLLFRAWNARVHRPSPGGRGSAILRIGQTAFGLCLLLIPIAATAAPLESVKDEYVVKVWESDQAGLPHYCFTTIAQTPDGYLWLGSFANLSRFDGTHFTVFDQNNRSPEVAGHTIRKLVVDHEGTLWVAMDLGIARRTNGCWQVFNAAQGVLDGMVASVSEDRHGNIFACIGQQIVRFEKGRFVPFPAPDCGDDRSPLSSLTDTEGILWVYNTTYLGFYRDGKWNAVPLENNQAIAGAAASRDDGIWIAESKRIRKFKDGRWLRTLDIPAEFQEEAITLLEDSHGNLWTGGYTKGVLAFMTNGVVLRCTTEDGLDNNTTLSLFEDQEGHIWIGSNGGGLARLRPRSVTMYGASDGLLQKVVNSIVEESPGHLLVATHGGGLVRFNGGRFGPPLLSTNADTNPKTEILDASSWVHTAIKDSAGVIWAGTYDNGLFRIEHGIATRVPLEGKDNNVVYALFIDSKGRLWISTAAELICQDRGRFTHYGADAGLTLLPFRTIAEDDAGNIWTGKGEELWHQQDGHFLNQRFAEFKESQISSLTTTRDRSLWIGTDNGRLGRFRNGKLFVYSEKHGLPDVAILSMIEDDGGDLWLGTSDGLLRITRASLDAVAGDASSRLDCLLLGKSDGMPSNGARDGFQPLNYKDADGHLWFSTIRGLAMVNPKNIRVKSVPTPTRIEEVEIDETRLPLSEPLSQFIVPPGNKRVTIGYAGISLGIAEDVEFQYRRAGQDNRWIDVGTERKIRLYDLHPGSYQLTVRAMNQNRTWSDAEAVVAFTVQPFFWQTTWFRILAILGLVVGAGGITWRIQSRRHRRNWERREQERALAEERAQSAMLARSKRAIEEALQRFEAVIENAPMIAIQGFDQHGKIGHWNTASRVLYGFSSQEALGHRMQDLILSRENVGDFEAALQVVWQTGQPSERREWTVRTRQGEEKFVYASMFPIFSGSSIAEVFCMQLDITDRKLLEDRLRQGQKMEAVGQLAGGIAHDFNNILTVIIGHLGLLLMDPQLPASANAAIREVSTAAERAANLTRQLLAFSRRQVWQPKPMNLDETLTNLSNMLRRLLGEHIALNFHYAPEPAWIEADPGMMEQIVINLAVNARDAMTGGGELSISTSITRVNEEYVRRNAEARVGRFVCLSVNDSGCGMDEITMTHIFEPFFTTKEVGKGTGLGLAMVYGCTKQHRGWVEVKSAVGKGTTFKIFLPACDCPAPSETAPVAPKIDGGTETLLVVEDEPSVRELVVSCLRRYGYCVLEADDGPKALELWQQHREKIALLLTDMVMPGGMTGRDLAIKLKKDNHNLKVIYSSGYNTEMATGELPPDKDARYLHKPYSPTKLMETIRHCLDQQ